MVSLTTLRMQASSWTMHVHVQVRDSSGSQAQGGDSAYQPICSSKTFTTIVDQPLEKEVLPPDVSACH